MKILGIIPARYASSRFPGKPLVKINGKAMVARVYEQASKVKGLQAVYVATDDKRIEAHLQKTGVPVLLTAGTHRNGTERCAEAYAQVGKVYGKVYDYVLNIQGDEPFITPEAIEDLIALLKENDQVAIGTLVKEIHEEALLHSERSVKVVCNHKNEVLYFSRHTIPHLRLPMTESWATKHTFLKHIGLYAYRTSLLQELAALPMSSLEQAESLEQLRWLEHGYRIHARKTSFESRSIDTPKDLDDLLRKGQIMHA